MDQAEEKIPISIHGLVLIENGELRADNEQLHEKNDELKKEIVRLRKMITAFRGGSDTENKMDNYAERVKHGGFKPALNKDVTIDAIVTIIHDEGVTNIENIAAKLNTSYSTIYRRLKASKLYPIRKDEINDYYNLFIKDDSCGDESKLDTKWKDFMALEI